MSTIDVSGLVLHRGGKRVLHGIDLTITAGEITALVGANGAGKSSLVGAMAGVLPLTAKTPAQQKDNFGIRTQCLVAHFILISFGGSGGQGEGIDRSGSRLSEQGSCQRQRPG